MKKIITAIGEPIINKKLSLEKNYEILYKDIPYKDAILEIINNNKIDILILNKNLPRWNKNKWFNTRNKKEKNRNNFFRRKWNKRIFKKYKRINKIN